jgi:hypothetical protein
VALLGHGQSRDAIPALGSLAASDDPQMALAAAQALAAARDARAIPHLVPLLSHRWPGVRLAAIHGLGAAGGAASVNALGGVAAGGSEPMVPLRLEAIRHLGALGSRKALPALMEALKTPALASAAMQALRNITGENKGGQPGRWVAWWTGRDQRPRTTVRSDVLPESPNPLLPSGVPPEWSLPRKEPASFDEESGQPTELQP